MVLCLLCFSLQFCRLGISWPLTLLFSTLLLDSRLLIPIISLCSSNLSLAKDFVNMPANCSLEVQYFISNSPSCWNWRIAWNLIFMCLVLLWNTEFLDIAIANMLSQNNYVGSNWLRFKSPNIFLNQTSWFAAT